jgi:hypothetical protein
MHQSLLPGALVGALLIPSTALPASDAEIAELKSMLNAMKAEYEQRIQALENRLVEAEYEAARQREKAAESKPMTAAVVHPAPTAATAKATGGFGALTSGTAFNPQISVILDGNYYHDGIDGEGAALVGEAFQPSGGAHGHGHEGDDHGHGGDEDGHAHGMTSNGFNFREAEIAFSATVDPYFDASLYLAIDGDGNVDLEEGYFQTRNLPYGLKVKGGKFLSDFGYINKQHPHQWDFVDQNLAYLNLLGDHGLQDTGVQVTWLPNLPVYTLFGVEALQGDQEVFGATLGDDEQAELNLRDTKDGPRLWTAFAKVSPDIGENHALQIGLSYAHNTQHQEVHRHEYELEEELHDHDEEHGHEEEHEDEEHGHQDEHGHDEEHMHALLRNGLEGDADLWGVDLVYKYDAGEAYGKGNFNFQAEYLRSIKDTKIRSASIVDEGTGEMLGEETGLIGSTRKFTTDGLYAQMVYGFAPKWTAGLRYDVLGLTNKVSGGASEDFGSSDRWTLDVTWNLSEFSRLRAQYAHSDILVSADERESFDAFYLQFLMSLGTHGAHVF